MSFALALGARRLTIGSNPDRAGKSASDWSPSYEVVSGIAGLDLNNLAVADAHPNSGPAVREAGLRQRIRLRNRLRHGMGT